MIGRKRRSTRKRSAGRTSVGAGVGALRVLAALADTRTEVSARSGPPDATADRGPGTGAIEGTDPRIGTRGGIGAHPGIGVGLGIDGGGVTRDQSGTGATRATGEIEATLETDATEAVHETDETGAGLETDATEVARPTESEVAASRCRIVAVAAARGTTGEDATRGRPPNIAAAVAGSSSSSSGEAGAAGGRDRAPLEARKCKEGVGCWLDTPR